MLEIENASKVRIFGAKTEAFQPYATINGCNDIFITNVVDYCANGAGTTGANQIEISGINDKIELSNIIWIAPPAASTWKIVLDNWNINQPTRLANFLGVYHYNWSTISDVTVTGISKITNVNNTKITLYPNPAKDYLIFKLPSFHSNEQAQIFNTYGDLVREQKILSNQQTINIASLTSGLYFFYLMQENSSTKFVKQ
jgi:hypothetical protein